MRLTFNEIWRGIDNLAKSKGMSVSGLAGKAGLNPTTFNKSKRMGTDGRKRWPSTESVNKVLEATGTDVSEFLSMAAGNKVFLPSRTFPLIGMAKAGRDGFFDDNGLPSSAEGWDGVDFPDGLDENSYALEVMGDSMEPVYRDGDRLLVQPNIDVRKGDRVVVKTRDGEIMVKELKRKSARQIELKSLNPSYGDITFDISEIVWIARVLWVSQ